MNVRNDAALRSLDPAVATLTAEEQERARATLERIVASAPGNGSPQPEASPRARQFQRRLVLLATAVLTLIVGSVVVEGAGGGDAAYASWTATPSSVSSDALEAATSACKDQLRRSADDPYAIDMETATLVLAERRGDHVALLYRTDNPDNSTTCFMHNPQGSTDINDLEIASGGSTGPALKPPARGFTQGAVSEFDGASITDGAAGEAVEGVTIRAGTFTVNASVQNGRYAAWWPGPAFEDAPALPDGEGGPQLILSYDLTLTDGTVIRNAQPTHPA